MNFLIRSTSALASATSSSGLPCSRATLPKTCSMHERRPSASSGGSGWLGKVTAPKLPGDKIHVALNANELRLGFGQNLARASRRLRDRIPVFSRIFPCPIATRPWHVATGLFPETVGIASRIRPRAWLLLLRRPTGAFRRPSGKCPVRKNAIAPWFCLMAVSVTTAGGFCRLRFASATILGMLLHAGDAVGDVGFLGQSGLGKQHVNAVVDVIVI